MLTGLRDRVRQGASPSELAWPSTDTPQVLALAGRDSDNRTVSLIPDEATASIALYAVTACAADREAHVREVEQYGQHLPEGSYGKCNRQAIAARETRVAARLRAIERAYQIAAERDTVAIPGPLLRFALLTKWPIVRWNWSRTPQPPHANSRHNR